VDTWLIIVIIAVVVLLLVLAAIPALRRRRAGRLGQRRVEARARGAQAERHVAQAEQAEQGLERDR
jgi:uncharacterized membrane protein